MITAFASLAAVIAGLVWALVRGASKTAEAKNNLIDLQEDISNAREIERKADLARGADVPDPVERLRKSGRIRTDRKRPNDVP